MAQDCTIVFWDVQHGHSTYIKTPNGRHIMVDLGTGDYSGKNIEFSPLRHLKYSYGIQQLDNVFITHPHLDHIDDILNFDLLNPKVLTRPSQLSNEEVMEGAQEKDRKKLEKYCEINNRYNSPVDPNGSDNISNPENWGGLQIQFFSPSSCNHNNFNNHSIVVVLEFATIKIVIPGDNEKCSFEELMARQSFMTAIKNADILLAPHHGRESGYNVDFMNQVNPRLSIVSDGRFCETSANSRYSAMSRGWTVHKKSGKSETRKCLTTNSDGEILTIFGYKSDGKPYLSVTIE
ncbi:MAG: MBL fold metallo-hydrolase [Bacteroidales bacterium]|nr:MBL fold metallo-hydrolase [Bacteroidales bacterium]